MTQLKSRRALLPLFSLLVMTTCCSCMQTPQERLVGRWFNSQNSIRFKEDGTLIWNGRRRQGYGRYWYTGESRKSTTNQLQPNLTIQLRTGDTDAVTQYELQYMGDDRLRLQQIIEGRRIPRGLVVLAKADADDTLTTELASR
ncbi:hypothetical protein GC176_05725 [bacterium]|nr:hypothetical protein [bacterium]